MEDHQEAPATLAVMQLALMALAVAGRGAGMDGWSVGLGMVLAIGSSIIIYRHSLHISANLQCITGRTMTGIYLLCLFGQLGPSVFLFGQPISFVGISVVLPLWMIVCALFSKSPPKTEENQDRS